MSSNLDTHQRLRAYGYIASGVLWFFLYPVVFLCSIRYLPWWCTIVVCLVLYGGTLTIYECVSRGRLILQTLQLPDLDRIVLYLRSFKFDGQSCHPLYGLGLPSDSENHAEMVRRLARELHQVVHGREASLAITQFWNLTYEQQISFAMGRIGRVVAIYDRRRYALQLGIFPLLPSADWQGLARWLIQSSQMIIIRAGETPSLEWELQQTRLLARPDKVLICFPRDAFGGYETSLEEVLKSIESGLDVKIDYPEGTPMIIGFDSRWNPYFYEVKSTSVIGTILFLHANTLIRTLGLALKDRGLPFRRVLPLTSIIPPLVFSAFYIALLALAISALRSVFGF
jgi:hypothetical protein